MPPPAFSGRNVGRMNERTHLPQQFTFCRTGLRERVGVRADPQTPHHEIHPARPVLEVRIRGQRAQVLEEGPPRPTVVRMS